MALPQQKIRELVFEILYSYDFHDGEAEELCNLIMAEHKVSKKNALDALAKAQMIHKMQGILDALIQRVSHSYDLKRIHSIERTILRLALYELFIEKKNPPEIVIAEAKRLTRKFTSSDAQGFVHALIDALIKAELKAEDLE